MSEVRCIIVEDEYPALELLRGYLKDIPNWVVAAEFTNAIDAIVYLNSRHVDVIFLDIQLPKLSGIDFIKSMSNPPLIVITSAYNEHAIEAFELVVFDYLLKPYPFERFIKTINRLNEVLRQRAARPEIQTHGSIIVKENRQMIKVDVDDILFVESQKEYVVLRTRERQVKVRMSMKMTESLLSEHDFIRVHRSFMIPTSKIISFSSRDVKIEDHVIPIGRLYQKEVMNTLGM